MTINVTSLKKQKWGVSISLSLVVPLLALTGTAVAADTEIKAAEPLQEVVVISSRYPVPLSDVVGSVHSISSAEIEERMVGDLHSLLATTVGVSVNRRQAYGRTYNDGVSIRGLGGKRVNILIDGIRIADAYTGYGRDVIDISLLKQVEILKGPSSALYGSDGLAGVVSYITKDPADLATKGSPYTSLRTHYDSATSSNKIGLLTAIAGDKLDGLIQIAKQEINETQLHSEADLTPNPMDGHQDTLFGKLKYNISATSALAFTADIQRWEGDWDFQTDIGMSFFPTIVNTSESIGADKGSRDRFSLDYTYESETLLADEGKISLYSQATDQSQVTNKQTQTFGAGLEARPTAMAKEFQNYQFNQKIEGISVEYFKSLTSDNGRAHQIVYGAELEQIEVMRPRYKTSMDLSTGAIISTFGGDVYPNKTFPDTKTRRTGIFVNDRITLTDRATIVFGLRYDEYKLSPSSDALFANSNVAMNALAKIDDGALSTKFGFLYDLSDQVSVFAQYAEGFRSPDYESANLTFTNFAYYYSVAPNANLESEESAGFELGIRGNHRDLAWALTTYQTDYKQFIETALTGATSQGISIYQYVNKDDVKIQGLEFEVQKTLSKNIIAKVSANRTYGESKGEKLTTINPSEGILSLKWISDSGKLSIMGITTMVASGPSDLAPNCGRSGCSQLLELPGRVTSDIFLDYQLTEKLGAKIGVTNLTDVKYSEWSAVNGKLASDPNLDLFLQPGREFSAALRYTF